MAVSAPLLTIGIPTYNRAPYLALSLAQLRQELGRVEPGLVEVLVSDNCSSDSTPDVVREAIAAGLPIRSVRNAENLGWARNFVQSFQLAQGHYVLLMGDDDLLVDGALAALIQRLSAREYGVVCLRPYGFDDDFRLEHPGGRGREREFTDAHRYLLAIGRYFTLTSSCVINKRLVSGVDPYAFVDTNLAVFHLTLRAAITASRNLYLTSYLIASKRQNSSGYRYAEVFVCELWRIIDAQVEHGLRSETVRALERQKLLSYYPFYLFDLRLSERENLPKTHDLFSARFHGRPLYRLWLEPVMRLPRAPALAWGAMTTVVGRLVNGDLRRGLAFAAHRATRLLARRRPLEGAPVA